MAEGRSSKAIAEQLFVSEYTVESTWEHFHHASAAGVAGRPPADAGCVAYLNAQ